MLLREAKEILKKKGYTVLKESIKPMDDIYDFPCDAIYEYMDHTDEWDEIFGDMYSDDIEDFENKEQFKLAKKAEKFLKMAEEVLSTCEGKQESFYGAPAIEVGKFLFVLFAMYDDVKETFYIGLKSMDEDGEEGPSAYTNKISEIPLMLSKLYKKISRK